MAWPDLSVAEKKRLTAERIRQFEEKDYPGRTRKRAGEENQVLAAGEAAKQGAQVVQQTLRFE